MTRQTETALRPGLSVESPALAPILKVNRAYNVTDIVDPATRSRMMAGIQGRHTQPELAVRRYLHGCGLRFRLHRRDLPGTPDLALPRYRCAVFVHGCFWHRHAGCFYSTSPATRKRFWRDKLDSNVLRDRRQLARLNEQGWRVVIIWECGLKHSFEYLYEVLALIEAGADIEEWPAEPPRIRPA